MLIDALSLCTTDLIKKKDPTNLHTIHHSSKMIAHLLVVVL